MRGLGALLLAGLMGFPGSGLGAVSPPDPLRQQGYLQELLRILPKDGAWENWLAATGELPPDFEQMPAQSGLPDPLRFADGRLATRETWLRRRQELLGVFQRFLLGTFPGSPGSVRPGQVKTREETSALLQEVRLQFGPQNAAKLHVEFLVPDGEGPFPVVILPETLRPWALVGVSRGYLGCLYAATETRDDTEAWRSLWPEFDWARVTRRAWAVSRCVDYLLQVPFADGQRIAVGGHGLSAQVALVAGAIDRRLGAVLASSPGPGGICPFRFLSEAELGQGIESLTRLQPGWFHPRLRFFAGREDKLPVDLPDLLACLAPQPCLLATALEDPAENPWALEQAVQSARRVYSLFDRSRALALQLRPGGPETGPGQVESFFDWLDTALDRGEFPVPDAAVYPTYETWRWLSGFKVDPASFPSNSLSSLLLEPDGRTVSDPVAWWERRQAIRDRIDSTLGEAPPFAIALPGATGGEPAPQAMRLGRHHLPPDIAKRGILFGNDIPGDVYFALSGTPPSGRRPAVLWLPPAASPNGYMPSLPQPDAPVFILARAGFAVLAFDPIGTGSRLTEVTHFYHRYPGWSLLGKQIDDALASVEALLALDFVDPQRIYLLGFGSGSRVALHAAAFDLRIAGVAALGGLTPLRRDSPLQGSAGLARWSRWLPLHPHLADFIGDESRVPYDYHELLALVAPRPALLCVPRLDFYSNLPSLEACAAAARPVYALLGAPDHLQLITPADQLRHDTATLREVAERLAVMARLRGQETIAR